MHVDTEGAEDGDGDGALLEMSSNKQMSLKAPSIVPPEPNILDMDIEHNAESK
jgi:hypothetical protein